MGLAPALGFVALALAAALRLRRPALRFALALGVAAGAGALALAHPLATGTRDRLRSPREATFVARVERVVRSASRVQVDLGDASSVEAGERLPRRIRVYADAAPATPDLSAALPGDRLRLQARLRPPLAPANPGGRDRERELARAGIGAVGRPVHPALVVRMPEQEGVRPLRGLQLWRRRMGERLARAGQGGALLRALALGERATLSEQARSAFARLGVAHLLAVSGLHLALVAAFAYRTVHRLLLRSARVCARSDPRQAALACAAFAALCYALLAGWGVPVRRAFVMLAALVWSVAGRRPTRAGAPLAAAALGVLAFEPQALFQPGPQLSFAATAALGAAARRDGSLRASGPRGAATRLLAASATAIAATLPLAAWHFGALAPLGLLANAVGIPWSACVLLPAAFAAVAACALEPLAPALAPAIAACAGVAGFTLDALQAVAARVPPGEIARPPRYAMAAAAGLAWLAIRTRSIAWRVAALVAATLVLDLAPPAAIHPLPPRVVFLDVGQGDATLIQGRAGAVLVDAGTALPEGPDLGRTVVLPALRALGVRRLDLVVVSHADVDHRGGVASVLRGVPAARLWVPRDEHADPALEALVTSAQARGMRVEQRGAGDAALVLGDLVVTPLWPPVATTGLSRNDRSLVVHVALAGGSVLLPGDLEASAEAALLAQQASLRADVLKLPHHGSATSSSRALLVGVGGRLAVVSAPRFARFAMPAPEVVARARRAGYALRWTGRDGAVLVGFAPELRVRTWRSGAIGLLP